MPKTKQKAKSRKAKPPYPKPARTFAAKQSVPAAVSRSTTTRTPFFARRDNSVTIRHSEFFEPVGTPGAGFWTDTFAINPGNTSVFPWLATQAFAWERYRFKKLQFRYIPRVGTSQAGTLVLSPDYDADDDPPPNELVACSYADTVSGAPWQELVLHCNVEACLGGMRTKYVRVGALKKNNDIKMYDSLNLHVCRDSANSTAIPWGKLWVEYEVEFITPHTIPTPLTSTYSGINTSLLTPGHPVAPESTSIVGSLVEKAGPIEITDNGTISGTGARGWKISGLIPGARYIMQALARTASVSPWVYTSAPATLTSGLSLVEELVGTVTHTMTGAGRRMLMNDMIVQATEAVGSIDLNWGTTSGSLLDAAQLIVSPIVSDAAFTML